VLGAAVLCLVALIARPAAAGWGAGADDRRKGFPVPADDYRRGGGQHGGSPAVEYLVDWAPDPCSRTDADRGACVPGLVNCPGRPNDENNNWQLATVSWRVAGTQDWNELPAECLNRAVIGGPAEITPQIARAEVLERLPATTFTLSPGRAGIVNLPEIFSVNQPQEIVFTVPILGQQVTLRATGETYDWAFGDGTTISTDTPGTPYTAGSPCTRDDACDDYVHHTYTRASKDGYPVTVTITWHGQFAVGNGPFQDIPQRITVTSPAIALPVVETQVIGGR
jgi:hypothetical protein